MYAPVPSGTGGRKTGKNGISESEVLAEKRRVLRTGWKTQGVRSAENDRLEKPKRECPRCMERDRMGKACTGGLPNLELTGAGLVSTFGGSERCRPGFAGGRAGGDRLGGMGFADRRFRDRHKHLDHHNPEDGSPDYRSSQHFW